jgi:hypothetical protein
MFTEDSEIQEHSRKVQRSKTLTKVQEDLRNVHKRSREIQNIHRGPRGSINAQNSSLLKALKNDIIA